MNWKLRLQNKTTLISLIAAGLMLIYRLLDLAGVVLPVAQQEVLDIAVIAVDLLVMLGIVVDPTTAGVKDSTLAMGYASPSKGDTVS